MPPETTYTSRYEASWQMLKQQKIITVRLSRPELAPRFIKAIRKRKNLDKLYRAALSSQDLRDRLSWRITGVNKELLTIKLTISPISFADKI